jgi:UDP-glucose 4-epimerase
MIIGVAGAAGFIGSALVRHLAARHKGRLRLLARNPAALPDNSAHQAIEVCRGDLLSPVDCQRFADGVSVIYYLAHRNTPATSDADLPNDALLNCVPLLNLLQAIRALGTRPHIVYFGSGGAVYAPRPGCVPFTEDDSCQPASSYGIQKLMGEHYLRVSAERQLATATILRVGNAYGALLPGERRQGLIGIAINQALKGLPVSIFGNPANVRDYVHLDDICAAAERVLTPAVPYATFNIGTQIGYSVAHVLNLIERALGVPIQREISEDAVSGDWLPEWCVLDIARAKKALGWEPQVDLKTGIDRMVTEAAAAAPALAGLSTPLLG